MKLLTISLPDALFAELETASASVNEMCFTPASWAEEAVHAALATRRLPFAWTAGGYGGRHAPRIVAAIEEPEGYPVHWPEGISSTPE